MPRGPAPGGKWLSFQCPFCEAALRIKAAYAHLRGRCPECGRRIEALQPRPRPRHRASDAEEPQGLVPIEEEWPEPAELDTEEGSSYGLSTSPPAVPVRQPTTPSPDEEVSYPLEVDERFSLQPTGQETTDQPFGILTGEDLPPPQVSPPPAPLPPAEEVNLLLREPPPKPPARPFWDGIYTFPWRLSNVGVWLALGMGFSVTLLLAGLIHWLYLQYLEGSNIGGAIPIAILAMVMAFFPTASYAVACFRAVIEDTAAGSDQCQWPDIGVECFWQIFYFLWVSGCSMVPAVLLWGVSLAVVPEGPFQMVFGLVPGILVFSVFLLSSLAADSWWMLLDRRIISGLLRRPRVLGIMWLGSLALLLPCFALAYSTVLGGQALLAFIAGGAWAAGLMIYGRLLGRVGWILTGGGIKKKRRRKKRRQPVDPSQPPDESGFAPGPPDQRITTIPKV